LELLRDLDTKDINKISGIFADKIYKIWIMKNNILNFLTIL
jgi:hypothetical protein